MAGGSTRKNSSNSSGSKNTGKQKVEESKNTSRSTSKEQVGSSGNDESINDSNTKLEENNNSLKLSTSPVRKSTSSQTKRKRSPSVSNTRKKLKFLDHESNSEEASASLAPCPAGTPPRETKMSTKILQPDGAQIINNKLRPSIDTDLASRVNKLSMEHKSSEPAGVSRYFETKIQNLALQVNEKGNNVRRLQAQRNELNTKVRALREELQLLHEQASYVGEIIKPLDKKKVLVKINPEGKYIVDIDKEIKIEDCLPNTRVALRADSYTLHKILPNKIDPLVSLMMVEKVPDSTYDMVGGLTKQIKEIKEVIELPVKHPELFEALGIAQPKGVLLYGPPGTGKTLLARAVAHHTDCTFIRVSGSELVQKFIGEGSRMVRELFVMARQHSPSIIFMDEIDSIGSSRLEGGGGGDSEVQRTMLELLNQLDGFEPHQNIKIIMATNRIDILDSALLRPGRIDRKIEFPAPNEDARLDILKIHSRKMNLTRGIDLRKVAELMPGASGAEVKGVCTEAGMFALRERRVHVTQEDFEMAVAKIMQRDQDKNISIKKLMK